METLNSHSQIPDGGLLQTHFLALVNSIFRRGEKNKNGTTTTTAVVGTTHTVRVEENEYNPCYLRIQETGSKNVNTILSLSYTLRGLWGNQFHITNNTYSESTQRGVSLPGAEKNPADVMAVMAKIVQCIRAAVPDITEIPQNAFPIAGKMAPKLERILKKIDPK